MTKLCLISAVSTLIAISACGGSAFTAGEEQGGSAGANAGSAGTNAGGAISQGGVATRGGATASDGGSAPMQGGASATGGSPAGGGSGGASGHANGGAVAAGGKGGTGSGGAGKGGAVNSGGSSSKGGSSNSGGSVALGGAPSTGGVTGVGGTLGLGGIGTGTGGVVGAGGSSGTDCTSLWQSYSQEMQLARVCSLNSMTKQCASVYMLHDACGCDVPANGTSEHYTKALELYDRWTRSCSGPVCLIACQVNDTSPTCKASASTTDATCSW